MSGNLDEGIDLNSDAAPVEANGDGVLFESAKIETLMMEPSSEGGVAGVGLSDEARVSGNGKGASVESVGKVPECDENGKVDLGLNGEVSGLDRDVQGEVDREKEEARKEISEEQGGPGCSVGEVSAIDLVVDLNTCSEKDSDVNETEINGGLGKEKAKNIERTEKEGEYKVTDLVWAKVKSHPWWPGQIFDPSASTKKAKKYSKKDRFLIAYFGDQTFAWNLASQIKPFRMHFSRMEKQSNTESFHHAVDCALDEVSRRVEFGLACSCLSEEAYSRIKSQVVVNAGIQKEASRIDGGDDFSSVAAFEPAKVVLCVQDLAKDPFGGTDRLEISTVRAQLSAFYRWKGHYQLLSLQVLDGSDNTNLESELPLMSEEKVVEDAKPASIGEKGDLDADDGVSRKRKPVSDPGSGPSKKERCLSDLMSGGSSSIRNGRKNAKTAGSKRKAVESDGSMDEDQSGNADRKTSIPSPKRLFRVGDSIRRIARKLSESPSVLKKESERFKTSAVYPPADEILSQICLAATNPMEEHHSLIPLVDFSSDFRKYRLEKISQMREENNSIEKTAVEQAEQNAHQSEATEAAGLEGAEDSNPDEQASSEPKSPTSSSKSREENSAAALILKFADLDSIPSVTNLNEIFRPYGPLREMETEVLKKVNCAKVVFQRRSDAQTAFSSSGKFEIFGLPLISYRLDLSPTPRKTHSPGRKQNKKDAKSVKAIKFED